LLLNKLKTTNMATPLSRVDELRLEREKKEKELQTDTVKKILNLGIVKPKNFNLKSIKWEQAFILYAAILDYSLNKVKRVFELERNIVLSLDAIAKRYGKLPSELIDPGKTFSVFESAMFNQFVGINALLIEITERNKQYEAQKKAQLKGRK